jgi:hypothetical protein
MDLLTYLPFTFKDIFASHYMNVYKEMISLNVYAFYTDGVCA